MNLLRNDYTAASNWTLVRMAHGPSELFASILLRSDGGTTAYVRRPNFHAQRMLAQCLSGSLLRTELHSDTFSTEPLETDYLVWPGKTDVPSLEAVASLDGDKLRLVLLNRDLEKHLKTAVGLVGFTPAPGAKVRALVGDSLNATNDQAPGAVRVEESTLTGGSSFEVTLASHSLTTVSFERLRQ